MIRILGTTFAGLLGLAFGSFLNVCLSRWPQGESIVQPRSHCRECSQTLAWWENIPLVSWIFLGGRCRSCRAWIGWRYPLVELAVGGIWAFAMWRFLSQIQELDTSIQFQSSSPPFTLASVFGAMIFCWMLIGIAVLDAEYFWIADAITLPGIALGLLFPTLLTSQFSPSVSMHAVFWRYMGERLLGILAAAGLILLIRWVYWLIRRREGVGLGDAKLMALLAAWLGLPGALLAFGLGVVLGAVVSLALLAVPSSRRRSESWAVIKLPLGTFLCVGGVISALWGGPLIGTYLRWAGF